MQKKLIGMLLSKDIDGIKCAYAYNEMNDKGEVTKTNCRGNLYLLGDKETAAETIFNHVVSVLNESC